MKPTKSRKPLETKAEKEAAAKRAFFRTSKPLPIIRECTFEAQSDYVLIRTSDNSLMSIYHCKKRRFVDLYKPTGDVFLDILISESL
jgi:hypothetical protein